MGADWARPFPFPTTSTRWDSSPALNCLETAKRRGNPTKRLFRDFRVKWDKGFGAGGRRGIFLLQKAVTFSFAGFLEKEDAVVGVGMMV